MKEMFIKKSGLVITKLSRDFIITDTGTRLPSITEYADQLHVSRGMIQQGLAFLEEHDCIQIEKSHGTGTFLQKTNLLKLCENTGWDILTINMPVPATSFLNSLTTALYQQNNIFPIPLAMVYVTGAENRLRYLSKNLYDVTVVSASAAKIYCEKYDFLEEPLVLTNCLYAGTFHLYFNNPSHTAIADGMRIAYDASSTDHYRITQLICQGKNVIWVEVPFAMFSEALKNGEVDVIVHRKEFPFLTLEHLNPIPIELDNYSTLDTITPVLLFHKENYGIRALFEKYLDVSTIYATQQKVLSGKMEPRFF